MSDLTLDDVRLYKPKNVNKENVREWVAALRGRRFRQVQHALSAKMDTGKWGHCCLGVACEVAGTEKPDASRSDGTVRYYGDTDTEMPPSVKRWMGVGMADPKVTILPAAIGRHGSSVTSLAGLNDDYGWTFKQIADLIERDWL